MHGNPKMTPRSSRRRIFFFTAFAGACLVAALTAAKGLSSSEHGSQATAALAARRIAVLDPRTDFQNALPRFGSSFAMGDLDGDGWNEVLVGDPDYLGSDAPHRGAVEVMTAPGFSQQQLIRPPPFPKAPLTMFFGHDVAIGDIDGQGGPEIAVGAPTGCSAGAWVFVYFNGDTQNPWISPNPWSCDWGWRVEIGDVDGDALGDLVVSDGYGSVGIYLGPMNIPNNVYPDVQLRNVSFSDRGMALADMDGDGILDIVIGDHQDGQTLFGNVAMIQGGSWAYTILAQNPDPQVGSFGDDVAVADVDQDGTLDILTGAPSKNNRAGEGYLFLGPDYKTWRSFQARKPAKKNWYAGAVLATDFTMDGIPDLMYSARGARTRSAPKWPQGLVDVFPGPDFDKRITLTPPYVPGKKYSRDFGRDLEAGDINGDGVAELLVGAPDNSQVGVGFQDQRSWCYAYFPQRDLGVSTTSISQSTGGSVTLRLDGGRSLAGEPYWLLATTSGTTPGFPVGSQLAMLNPDLLTLILLSTGGAGSPGLTTGWSGGLDATGRAAGTFSVLPGGGGLVGTRISFLYLAAADLSKISLPVTVEVVP